MNVNKALLSITLICFIAAGAWFTSQALQQTGSSKIQLAGEGEKSLPAFSFTDLEGNIRQQSEWQGKVLVVNFWATWCPPCRKEMPLFVDMQNKYAAKGLQFIGIAIDNPGLVQDFYDVYGINFPVLIGGADAIQLSNRLGNRFESLPFTAIFDRDGTTRYVQAGLMTETILEEQLKPLL
ncbi:MAG: TlpA disulfide reductase family protein [Candidatus Sedimenticola sp. PURPLELP]